jgi:hypothetical protein
MRVQIIRPLPVQLEGFDLRRFTFGHTFDIQSPLSDLLVADAYAIPAIDGAFPCSPGPSTAEGRPRQTRRR